MKVYVFPRRPNQTVRDDYPAMTVLADACAERTDEGCPEAVRAWREIGRLRQWKEEAMAVLAEWDDVHYECAGASAHIGRSKAENVRRELRRLRGQCEVWMNGVADVVEPYGYDRRAANGPADLLPGLVTLAERVRAARQQVERQHHHFFAQGKSNVCVCGEWFDAEIHQVSEAANPFDEHTRMWADEIRGLGLDPEHVARIVAKAKPYVDHGAPSESHDSGEAQR